MQLLVLYYFFVTKGQTYTDYADLTRVMILYFYKYFYAIFFVKIPRLTLDCRFSDPFHNTEILPVRKFRIFREQTQGKIINSGVVKRNITSISGNISICFI